SLVSNTPSTAPFGIDARPASQWHNAIASEPNSATGMPYRTHQFAVSCPYGNRGARDHRIGTDPDTPSTLRASSRCGASLSSGRSIASQTRTTPLLVVNVVSRTFVFET